MVYIINLYYKILKNQGYGTDLKELVTTPLLDSVHAPTAEFVSCLTDIFEKYSTMENETEEVFVFRVFDLNTA